MLYTQILTASLLRKLNFFIVFIEKIQNCTAINKTELRKESLIFMSYIRLKNFSNKNDLLNNLSKQKVFFIVDLKLTSNKSNVNKKGYFYSETRILTTYI